MMSQNHKAALLFMSGRGTLQFRFHKNSNKRSETASKAIVKKLEQADYPLHTVTFEKDLKFANHIKIAEALNVDTYFTRPHTSQDKQSVENRIGQISKFFPKKTDPSMVTDYQVKRIEHLLKNRPVRKFNYLNPDQVLRQKFRLIT
jgi:IS30 family transposase